jgi:sensor histidine kinase YesM
MSHAALNLFTEHGPSEKSAGRYRWYEMGLHLLYWLAYGLLLLILMGVMAYPNQNNPNFSDFRYLFVGIAVIPAILGFYFSYFILASRFLVRGKMAWLWLLVPLSSWISTLTGAGIITLLIGKKVLFGNGWQSFFEISVFLSALSGVHVMLGIIIRGFFHGLREQERSALLEKKNLEMELSLIKASLDPHFLFNTLNNIDVLIEKNPAMASDYLHRLSELLRFVLYENKAPFVSLQTEMGMMDRYLELQRIRLSQPEVVDWRAEGVGETHEVPPMLFMPFLENIFKYGDTSKEAPQIKIHLRVKGSELFFTCVNGIRTSGGPVAGGGLGLTLIRRRLELLYPQRHTLDIQTENGIFSVVLKLQL